jgi:hypothetical protein
LHETHAPLQATLQQTPSTQKPEAQSLASPQVAPLALLPHLSATHCWPAAQRASVAHVFAQRWVAGSQL